MQAIKFSICIPNYNYAHYIDKTIKSILDQSYRNFEILVADNVSTDNSVEVIKSFGDDRIKVFENNYNVGFAPNLDKATEHATGDYMILVSSDDMMCPGALQEYANLIQQFDGLDTDLVISSDLDIINGAGEVTGLKSGLDQQVKNHLSAKRLPESTEEIDVYNGLDLFQEVMKGSFNNIGKFLSTCYSKRLFDQVEGYRSTASVIPDAFFSHKIMRQNPKTIFVKKPLFQYRLHEQNNYAQIFKNLKLYCDKYIISQMYSDTDLKPIGMTKQMVQENFIRHWCLKKPLNNLLTGYGSLAFRPYFFGLAAYPGLMMRQGLFWVLPFVVVFYPIIWIIYKLYKLVK